MGYSSLKQCIDDLEKHGYLIRIKEEVDPNLVMATIHLQVFEKYKKVVFFEKVKGSKYAAVSNLFGTLEISRFLFRDTLPKVQDIVELKMNPMAIFKKPSSIFSTLILASKALPKKVSSSYYNNFDEIKISDIPQIKCWEKDGGAFVTLPQVFTLDPDNENIMTSNLGMYRVQLSGNEYVKDKEIGLHYQLHRGIGVHQTKAKSKGKPLKVSVFIGGTPSHSFSAVMPLPENLSELSFAGLLGNRRFRYFEKDGFIYSADADFIITGEVYHDDVKPEGPFGDHLGYYSLTHDFPVLKVHKVLAKKDAVWAFTVVGRPPQEDTQFGALIHEITGDILPSEIPGLKEVNAVDAAGVHPLLITKGSERYTPFNNVKKPQEILTIANHILGTGQMSLAKFLFIVAESDAEKVTVYDIPQYFKYVLERINLERDIHFYTKTTIDTLDYSGNGLNEGSKVVFAVYDDKNRELSKENPSNLPQSIIKSKVVLDGVLAIEIGEYNKTSVQDFLSQNEGELFSLKDKFPLILVVDDTDFVAKELNNFLWVTFTRSNPANDIYGVKSFYENKHWACKGSLVIDARIKPHHAPPLEIDEEVKKKAEEILEKAINN